MKKRAAAVALAASLLACVALAQDRPPRGTTAGGAGAGSGNGVQGRQAGEPSNLGQPQPQPGQGPAGGHEPPQQAYEDCKGRKAGDTVQHTTPEGVVPATCEDSPKGLVARPVRAQGEKRPAGPPSGAPQPGERPQGGRN
jgi:hypothetical protein